ncbi:MAG: cytochrome c oxidase subunit 4 [Actinobacteria bacterium]|nr:cytochrome c oxidase subunit 4 [Actinomycetota bacterium]
MNEQLAPIEPATGIPTESKVFYALGTFAVVIDIIYVLASIPGGIEWSGTVSLAATAVFSLFFGYFLQRSIRRVQADVEDVEARVESGELAEDAPEALYLPETSIWPLGIGVGAGLTFAGLGFGWWFALPGVAILVHSAIGFAHQSRERGRD